MSEPFIAEIRIFGFNFAPRGWAFCNGQLLPINQNQALFSLLGTTYGGDGRTTFALPDLRDRVPVHAGQGPGLSRYTEGQRGGSETVTLTMGQMPAHNHSYHGSSDAATTPRATNAVLAKADKPIYQTDSTANLGEMAATALEAAGGGQPHNNEQPYLNINFCIALVGLFPSRN